MGLHIFFLPFHHSGHLIPMVDLAKLFAIRGVEATIVTTPATALRIQPSLTSFPRPVNLLILPCPENLVSLSASEISQEVVDYLESLESPFETLVTERRPDCIISDVFYSWSAHVASRHAIPRVALHVCSCFSIAVMSALYRMNPPKSLTDDVDDQPFVVPGLPHRIELSKYQLPGGSMGTKSSQGMIHFCEALSKTYGTIANTFRDMDSGYNERLFGNKTWLVGPVSLCNRDIANDDDGAERGGECDVEKSTLNSWLDGKKPGSVLYLCFGSLGIFSSSQLGEIATGLVASNHPFIWVVRNVDNVSMPEGYCEEKGLIIRGWAPQTVILNHPAVGGFVTHCGWNSIMEGANAGVPMITWPLFAEQFLNEILVVDVLRIGVPVGAKRVCPETEEKNLIGGGKVKEVVEEVMGSGAEAEDRRKRAKLLGEMATRAVEEGGSSYNDLSSLIQELEEIKATKSII